MGLIVKERKLSDKSYSGVRRHLEGRSKATLRREGTLGQKQTGNRQPLGGGEGGEKRAHSKEK